MGHYPLFPPLPPSEWAGTVILALTVSLSLSLSYLYLSMVSLTTGFTCVSLYAWCCAWNEKGDLRLFLAERLWPSLFQPFVQEFSEHGLQITVCECSGAN